jgi:hypothetical protein
MNSVQSPPASKAPLSQRTRYALAALAAATALFHLVFGLYYITQALPGDLRPTLQQSDGSYLARFPGWNTDWEADSAGYNRAAVTVLETGAPRNRDGVPFFRAAVYAYFLAACYAVGGVRLLAVAVPQAVLSGLACWFIGLAAARRAPRNRDIAAILAALLVLVNLRLAMYVAMVYPTALLMLFVALALWAGTWKPGLGRATVVALPLVLGAFAQGAFFVITFAAGIWFAVQFVRGRKGADLFGVGLVAVTVVVKLALTWLGASKDQWVRYDRGGTLWLANNPYYESMRWYDLWESRPGNPRTRWHASTREQQRYDHYVQAANGDELRAMELWVRDNPLQYAKLCSIRLRTELGPFTGQMSPRNRVVSTVLWLLIFPAGFYGLWRARGPDSWQLAVIIVLCSIVFHSLVISGWYLRYRVPMEIVLIPYAGIGYAVLRVDRSNSSNTAAIRFP